jgi:phage terminase large subunit-like protein
LSDPGFLPAIFEAKLEDDWTDPKTWAKANPNLGKSVSMEYLERECARAKDSPAYENTFKRLHLNIRTESQDRLLDMHQWTTGCGGATSIEDYAGKEPAGAALDLGNVSDFTTLCVLYDLIGAPEGASAYAAFWWHWTPKLTAEKRQRRAAGANYTSWARDGWMTLTEGDTTDYAQIVADITAMAPMLNLKQIAVDRLFQGAQACTSLQNEGFEVLEFGQGFLSMAAPTLEFLDLVKRGALKHGDNPCVQWQAGNLMGQQDSAGNLKPDKAKSGNKIDGIVACIMACGIAAKRARATSWLENNGVIFIS